MDVIVGQKELQDGLTDVLRGVAKRSTLPVLHNVYIEAQPEHGELILRSTNLQIGVTVELLASVQEAGKTTLDARVLADLVKDAPGKSVKLQTAKSRLPDVKFISGVMLLAAASNLPAWMVQLGLVQFYGQDIDRTCVQMARANCRLYGLNGIHVQWALALSEAELAALPEPHGSLYREAQEAHEAGDEGRVSEIEQALRAGEGLEQMSFMEEVA